ncbi:hypothetical protein B0H39_002189 [Clostridium beijerinckii]|uniref:hypothetical protein n=1 Tax=Clostridium beijerinckii TaxID=1520 RepID=UPI0004253735|nr:hypothetical protein [Clostridium beijerinckii]
MTDKVALIKFPRGSFDQEYSYFTDMDDLVEGNILVVPTSNSYSIGVFSRYSKSKIHMEKAEKWVVKNISPDIEAFEEKMFLGGFD